MEKSDAELIDIVRRQMVELLGIPANAQPVFASVYRWIGGMPQYTLGHLDRVDEIEARSAAVRGFALAGGGYRGVGIPNCIESGEAAAGKVLADLGVEYAEEIAAQRAY
jgi:oxygen-dependent protoporphyrinogen oxidase